jgi:hypothetical protein
VIKFGNNNLKAFAELEVLKELKNLKNLDLVGNPYAEVPGYRERVLEFLPDLVVLDNITRDGEEYISEDEDEEEYGEEEEGEAGEEGEFDGDDGEYDDEEGEFDDEYGEEGEDDLDDEEEESAELGKRKK